MELRPYQIKAQNAILDQWKEVLKTLLVLPTGTGKTIVFCKLIEILVARGERVLILAHREELIRQAADKLIKSTGLGCSIEKAAETAIGEWYRVTSGSVQTLMREKRLEQFPNDFYDTIIVDEAHHALSTSYRKVLDYFNNAKVLGVTATPSRGDKKNLGELFESIAYEYTLPEAIKDKYLVPIQALTIPLKIELGNLSTMAGDFKLSELDDKLAPYLDAIAEEIKTHCMNRKTIVFLPLIKTSQAMCSILNNIGMNACEVNGKSKDRKEVLIDFAEGKYNVLCNSMLLTEGYDEPTVDCIVCLRPTKIRELYCQIVGRGTRLSPETGKENLLILDFLWNTERHSLCRPAHIIAPNEDVANKMIENMIDNAGDEIDLEEAEEKAAGEVVSERENALAEKLKEQRSKKRKLVDPLQFAVSINSEDLISYEPIMSWESAPASDKQIAALERFGIFPEEIQNAGYAAKLLDRLHLRRMSGYATPKQIRFLEKRKFNHVGMWQFTEANSMITSIATNNWRTPNGVIPQDYNPSEVSI